MSLQAGSDVLATVLPESFGNSLVHPSIEGAIYAEVGPDAAVLPGNKFLKELVECDELTASYIETRSKNIYSQQKILSEPSATTGLPLSDTLTYVVPFEDLSDQVSYYLKMIEIGAVEWNDKPGPQAKTVLTALVKELAVGWKEATGAEAKGNSKFIGFVCEVSVIPSIRRIVRPGEGYRRKVRAAMNKVLA